MSSYTSFVELVAHAVFDVVVDDEVQFLFRKAVMLRQQFVDLVFYNFLLKCFVLIDLKRGMVKHQDIGQMNMYLNYFKSEVGGKGDSEPVGIILGANKDDLVVQFATQGISNRLFVSKYQLYLPDENQLRGKLAALLDGARNGKRNGRKHG